jgi:hypothetical protein
MRTMPPAIFCSILAYLLTTLCAFTLLRRSGYNRRLRILMVVIGILSLCQAVNLLGNVGVWVVNNRVASHVDLFVGYVCLVAIYILEKEARDRKRTDMRLRLVEFESNAQQLRQNREPVICEANARKPEVIVARSPAAAAGCLFLQNASAVFVSGPRIEKSLIDALIHRFRRITLVIDEDPAWMWVCGDLIARVGLGYEFRIVWPIGAQQTAATPVPSHPEIGGSDADATITADLLALNEPLNRYAGMSPATGAILTKPCFKPPFE